MNDSAIEKYMKNCTLCPRRCGADRTIRPGACGAGDEMMVARAALHFWEEPVISGSRGSGAVFFSGCSLGCIFCQNAAISHISGIYSGKGANTRLYKDERAANSNRRGVNRALPGKPVAVEKLADIFLRLQDEEGANNINLVTAAHFAPQAAAALETARANGLTIPVVYNSSGYECAETLKMLDGLVDVYLPDFKYITPELARKFSKAEDYPTVAAEALDEMARQVGEAQFAAEVPFDRGECEAGTSTERTKTGQIADKKGAGVLEKAGLATEKSRGSAGAVYAPGGILIKQGVIVRNLLLPGHVHESEAVLRFLHERYGDRIYISIMNQYTPMPGAPAGLDRKVTKREYGRLVDFAINIGIENGFVQDGGTAKASFIPEWNGEGVN